MVFITIVTGANLNQQVSWGPHIVGNSDRVYGFMYGFMDHFVGWRMGATFFL